ncbi:General stress protein 69 [Mucisphaera calidilacus]|uniref:General stress protein 69 n=2 Tax=Mucisphaera calidilacus TaxID=2527982 RepID=A0A518BXD7_9BACT|nr:General stress protein 69 [Mucisphaera calidilacus]
MPTRELHGLGWHASLLTLGGVKWDSKLSESEAIELIHRAIDLGVNTIDTAAVYAGGESERRLGKALRDRREGVWVNTKTTKRSYDEAREQIDLSFKQLQTDVIDLMFVHSVEDDDDVSKILDSNGVLRAIESYRDAGQIKHIGVSGHWYKQNMTRVIEAYPFEAILCPVGIFNEAYGYSYLKEVVPVARERGLAVLGMKVMAAGRVAHTADPTPYLRFAIGQDIDTAVIGCESIEQLEFNVATVKSRPEPMSDAEAEGYFEEARRVTEHFDSGEFSWVSHYR